LESGSEWHEGRIIAKACSGGEPREERGWWQDLEKGNFLSHRPTRGPRLKESLNELLNLLI
jgi:hypothetical protein